jgi:hypothetical protein
MRHPKNPGAAPKFRPEDGAADVGVVVDEAVRADIVTADGVDSAMTDTVMAGGVVVDRIVMRIPRKWSRS